jgi:hypothetical protein
MSSRRRLFALLSAVAAVSSLLVGSSASGAGPGTRLGGIFYPDSSSNCPDSTWLQISSADNRSTVPRRGVITSYRLQLGAAAPANVGFRLGRPDGANWQIVAAPALVAGVANAVVERRVRIRALPGDVLGAYYGAGASPDCGHNEAGYSYLGQNGNITTGALSPNFSGGGFRFSVDATLEPDADRDGFGDITQDGCPIDRTRQGACDRRPPQTGISSVTPLHRTNRIVVRFFSTEPRSTFRCAVDGPGMRACTSPFTVRVAPGRHVVGVQATDRWGNTDRTPAVAVVRVN